MDLPRLKAAWLGIVALVFGGDLACGGSTGSDGESTAGGGLATGGIEAGGELVGGSSATGAGGVATAGVGGTSTGGTAVGGSAGGSATGGEATGGVDVTGGVSAGGATTGGENTGGTTTGGGTGGTAIVDGGGAGGENTGGTPSGGENTGGAETGGAGAGGAETGGAGAGGAAGSGGVAMGCFVGVQIDNCCSEPIAADKTSTNPCLLPYKSFYTDEDFAQCPAAEQCLMVNCVHPPPPSRVVARRSGECVFDDECITAAEPFSFCQVATDYDSCCSCPEVIPTVIVDANPCILTEGRPPPGTCADCSAVDCAPCNAPLPTVFCEYDDNTRLSLCRGRTE